MVIVLVGLNFGNNLRPLYIESQINMTDENDSDSSGQLMTVKATWGQLRQFEGWNACIGCMCRCVWPQLASSLLLASTDLSWPQLASACLKLPQLWMQVCLLYSWLELSGLELPQLASNCLSWPQFASAGLNLPQLASTVISWPEESLSFSPYTSISSVADHLH